MDQISPTVEQLLARANTCLRAVDKIEPKDGAVEHLADAVLSLASAVALMMHERRK